MNKQKINIFIFSSRLFGWLTTSLVQGGGYALPLIRSITEKAHVIYLTRGKPEAIKYMKSLRLKFIKYIFNLDFNFVNTGDQSIPKSLRPLVRAVQEEEDYPIIRLILSSLYLTRALRLEPIPSFKTIRSAAPLRGIAAFDNLINDMYCFVKELGVNPHQMGKVPSSLKFRQFHMTSKSGPNGHALWTSFIDNEILPDDLKECIKILAGDKLADLMSRNLSLYRQIPSFFRKYCPRKRTNCFRRLVVIADKEGKSREVAIGDYWSQAALKPLHNKCYKLLSSIHQDCTFEQHKHIGLLTPTQGSSYHSIDLTAFSDLFPIDIEEAFLRVWLGKDFATAWRTIMVKYPFDSKLGKISYLTGNPMGMYSSWAVSSLCHHFLIWKACKRASRNWRKCPYMLLGDDLVIADDMVAYQYMRILNEWFIPYSNEKTHSSKYGYEFAKQIVLHDMNVSPFPLAALYERRNSPIESVGIILSEVWSKSWYVELNSVIKDYYIIIQRWTNKRYLKRQPSINLVISLMAYLQGLEDLGKPVMDYVASWTGKDDWQFSKTFQMAFGRWLAMKTVHRLFEESRDKVTDYTNKQPLGELATEMVINITSLRDGGVDCFDLIESVPFLQVYGRAEETYLKLHKPLNDKGLGSSGRNLRDYIGKVDMPTSDRDFYIRHRDVIIIRALKSSRIIEELIKTTPQVKSWRGQLDFTLPWYEHTRYEGPLLPDRRMGIGADNLSP